MNRITMVNTLKTDDTVARTCKTNTPMYRTDKAGFKNLQHTRQ